jgi:hypothetical protein
MAFVAVFLAFCAAHVYPEAAAWFAALIAFVLAVRR